MFTQIKEQVEELARTYITPESLNAATLLVSNAIDNYTFMQAEKDKQTNAPPNETLNDRRP